MGAVRAGEPGPSCGNNWMIGGKEVAGDGTMRVAIAGIGAYKLDEINDQFWG